MVFATKFKNEVARDKLIANVGGVKIKNLDLIEGAALLTK